MKSLQMIFSLFGIFVMAGCASATVTPIATPAPTSAPAQILFDDFSYSTADEMSANGWILRSGQGWPGVTDASFRAENVSFIDYPAQAGNRLLRMTSSTGARARILFKLRSVINANIS